MNKPNRSRRKPKVTKVTKVTKVVGAPVHSKVERTTTTAPVFANPYGRNVAAGSTFKKVYGKKIVKILYSAEGSNCKSSRDVPCSGKLLASQWNRLVCSKCNYSELV